MSNLNCDEEGAFKLFCRLRWPVDGRPICPYCGSEKSYLLKRRRRFTCASCAKQFSPTSGTVFGGRKMRYSTLLYAADIIGSAKESPTQHALAEQLQCQPKTAFVLLWKMREAMRDGVAQDANNRAEAILSACLSRPASETWARYWQRSTIRGERT